MPAQLSYDKQEADLCSSIYLTRKEAGKYLNVPAHWLANNAKLGPRYIKIGGLVRYSVAALDSYMASHEGKHQ
ncbi:hypothetical protein [Arthrobacter sp. SAFR-044]|uniref:hypothetical protein n=1 Tax=Arthrobacter sp. SAFR-044 TaxID=3387278 RepID=UPI003F7BE584